LSKVAVTRKLHFVGDGGRGAGNGFRPPSYAGTESGAIEINNWDHGLARQHDHGPRCPNGEGSGRDELVTLAPRRRSRSGRSSRDV